MEYTIDYVKKTLVKAKYEKMPADVIARVQGMLDELTSAGASIATVNEGPVEIPANREAQKENPYQNLYTKETQTEELIKQHPDVDKFESPSFIEKNIYEPITGAQRETKESRTLGDWSEIPELNKNPLNPMNWGDNIKTLIGTSFANQKEIGDALKRVYPGLEIRDDKLGNPVIKSAIDGKEYSVKPGFRHSDIPRAAYGAVAAAASSALAAAGGGTILSTLLGGVATQEGIEALQGFTGKPIGLKEALVDPLLAGAGDVIIPYAGTLAKAGVTLAGKGILKTGKAIGGLGEKMRPLLSDYFPKIIDAPTSGLPATIQRESLNASVPSLASQQPIESAFTLPQSVQKEIANPVSIKGLESPNESIMPSIPGEGQFIEKTAQSLNPNAGVKEYEELARSIGFNQPVHESMKAIGVAQDVPVMFLATDKAAKNALSAFATYKASKTGAQKYTWLDNFSNKVIGDMEDMGATQNWNMLSPKIKNFYKTNIEKLSDEQDVIYKDISEAIPISWEGKGDLTKEKIEEMAINLVQDIGDADLPKALKIGIGRLPKPLQTLYKRLNEPRKTYHTLNGMKQEVGRGFRKQVGEYESIDPSYLIPIYGTLAEDLKPLAQRAGKLGDLEKANALHQLEMAAIDDSNLFFGKYADKNFVKPIESAIESIGVDDSLFNKTISALSKRTSKSGEYENNPISDDMREQVILSGVLKVFTKDGYLDFPRISKFMGALDKSPETKAEFLTKLPESAREYVIHASNVANNVYKIGKELTPTGLTQTIRETLEGAVADTANKMMDVAAGAKFGPTIASALGAIYGTPVRIVTYFGQKAARAKMDKAISPIILADKAIADPKFGNAFRTGDFSAFVKDNKTQAFKKSIKFQGDNAAFEKALKFGIQTTLRNK